MHFSGVRGAAGRYPLAQALASKAKGTKVLVVQE
jgi:hypothetical protein